MSAPSVQPALRLFGVPQLEGAAGVIPFTQERPFRLLAYLACRRQWVRRDELCDLLWPDHGDLAAARNNLRKVLLLAARVPGVETIERRLDLVRWLPDSDLARFERACDAAQWAEAIELQPRPLLEGADATIAPAWLAAERQRLEGRWHHACDRLLAERAGRPNEVAMLAERMLARDRLDETAIHALARARLALGQRDAAAKAIATYAATLGQELGLEPSASLRTLARQIRATPASQDLPVHVDAALVERDALVGRRVEVADILRRLQADDVRCLTIQGPGGIGKSSVARAVVRALAAQPAAPQAVWIALSDLTDAGQVPERLAGALKFALNDQSDPWAAVQAALGRVAAPVVLVFDNAEHLALAMPIEHLIATSAQVRCLVTSRSRIGARGEQLYLLEGLPLPDSDETEVEILRRCDAVRLFELRAGALAPGFDLAAEAADVVRLVNALEGLPLAIELAASWTRALRVREILAELGTSLDLLDDATRPERGLRASFAQSWRLLSPAERESLPRLALLPGSFDRAMALHVGHAPLPVLAALLDKSLVRRSADGRYSMHALIRQCAREHAPDAAEVRAVHARRIVFWLGGLADATRVVGTATLDEIEAALPDVRAAWTWAVAQHDVAALAAMTEPVAAFFETRGPWQEGLRAVEAAIAAIEARQPADTLALGAALRAHARLALGARDLDLAEASARRLLKAVRPAGSGLSLVLSALNTLGKCLMLGGRLVEAQRAFGHGRRRAQGRGTRKELSWFTANLAIVDTLLGHYDRALAGFEAMLQERERLGDVAGMATALNNIASAQRGLGRPLHAREAAQSALGLCERHRLLFLKASVLLNLGAVHRELGAGAEARSWLARALAEARAREVPDIEAETLLEQARLESLANAFTAARRCIGEALAVADRMGADPLRVLAVVVYGEVLVAEGRRQEGGALLRWAAAHPALQVFDRNGALRVLAALDADAPSGNATALRLDSALPLAEVLERLPRNDARADPR